MMISWYLTYRRRITVSVGLIVILLGLSSWSGPLPTSSDLGHFSARCVPKSDEAVSFTRVFLWSRRFPWYSPRYRNEPVC